MLNNDYKMMLYWLKILNKKLNFRIRFMIESIFYI